MEELEDIKNVNVSLMDRNTELLKMLASINKHHSSKNHYKFSNYNSSKTIDTSQAKVSNQLRFYIDVDTKLVVSPYATYKQINGISKWLTSELSHLLTEHIKNINAEAIIYSQENTSDKFSCKLNNNQLDYKELILIKPTLIAYRRRWYKLEIDLINCHNAATQTVTFDNFTPTSIYEETPKLWSGNVTKENLQELLLTSINKINNNSGYDDI